MPDLHAVPDRHEQPLSDRLGCGLDPPDDFAALIEASSLGTDEAVALRATVTDQQAARIVALSRQIEREDRAEATFDAACRWHVTFYRHGDWFTGRHAMVVAAEQVEAAIGGDR